MGHWRSGEVSWGAVFVPDAPLIVTGSFRVNFLDFGMAMTRYQSRSLAQSRNNNEELGTLGSADQTPVSGGALIGVPFSPQAPMRTASAAAFIATFPLII